jgi:hypothetical protein
MASKEETLLLNLMETGIVSEIKHGKTRNGAGEDSVFATINNISKGLHVYSSLCLAMWVWLAVVGFWDI